MPYSSSKPSYENTGVHPLLASEHAEASFYDMAFSRWENSYQEHLTDGVSDLLELGRKANAGKVVHLK